MPSPRRIHRISQALHRRQHDLIVAIDRVHDRHNISAILRSADAVGVSRVIWEPDPRTDDEPINPEISRGTERWVQLSVTKQLTRELQALKKKGFKIAATHLSHKAVDFRSIDWTQKWVIILGNEHAGCSEAVLAEADENVILPMMGLVQSLNVSVATAVMLYEIQRQRQEAGMYQRTLPKRTVQKTMKDWGLAADCYRLEDLLAPPPPDSETPPEPVKHSDGRIRGFSRTRRRREREAQANESGVVVAPAGSRSRAAKSTPRSPEAAPKVPVTSIEPGKPGKPVKNLTQKKAKPSKTSDALDKPVPVGVAAKPRKRQKPEKSGTASRNLSGVAARSARKTRR